MTRGHDMLTKGMTRLKADLGESFVFNGSSYVGIVGQAFPASEGVDFAQGGQWLIPVRFHRADFGSPPKPGQYMTSAAHGVCLIAEVATNQDAVLVYLQLRR